VAGPSKSPSKPLLPEHRIQVLLLPANDLVFRAKNLRKTFQWSSHTISGRSASRRQRRRVVHPWMDAVDTGTNLRIPNRNELDLWLQYRPTEGPLKGFRLKTQYANVWQQGNVRETQPEFRFIVDYTVAPPTSVRCKIEHPGGVCPTSPDEAAVLAASANRRDIVEKGDQSDAHR